MHPEIHYTVHDSPIGPLLLAGVDDHLFHLVFPQGSRSRHPDKRWTHREQSFSRHRAQLDEYFSGRRMCFDLSLSPQGTAFQKQVWQELLEIPYGHTSHYGELAGRINRPGASRAVGAANGANPIPVIIPCHRVIGKNGSLTGFGGGLETKQWLLAHERQHYPGVQNTCGQTELSF